MEIQLFFQKKLASLAYRSDVIVDKTRENRHHQNTRNDESESAAKTRPYKIKVIFT